MKKSPTTIKLHPEQYWKLRALMRDVETVQQQAAQRVQASMDAAQKYLQSLGLKIDVNYRMDDDTTSVTVVKQLPPGV